MIHEPVRAAFAAEAGQLAAVLNGVAAQDWPRPTPCPPWSVADLTGHVLTAVARIPGMLAEPAPPTAEVSAAAYYRPDERFSPQTNAERVASAQRLAGSVPAGHVLAEEFGTTWQHVLKLCDLEPADRVVRTRHGDAMLLTDFLTTRVVELGVHGLDLAVALDRPPWLTPAAQAVIAGLVLDENDRQTMLDLGWDDLTLVRKATGRMPMTAAEARRVHRFRRLVLG